MFNMGPSRPMNGMSMGVHARPGSGMINRINQPAPPMRMGMMTTGGQRPQPPMGGDPRQMIGGGGFNGGGTGMPGPMMDGGGMTMPPAPTGDPRMGMINMPPPSGGLIGQLTGGNNTGVMGPQMGQSSLWGNYANMMQGDGAPQKRNLIY